MARKRICFVTGTRAEFGLMRSALKAIQSHRNLTLQIVATGMHLDRSRGNTVKLIGGEGWGVGAVVPWPKGERAVATGSAMAGLAKAFDQLKTDVVLVVGDRVEALAAAAAGAISGKVVAHVHGGDRALGQLDDSLRHAITKLAHIHFPATAQSARRLARLGEDRWRIHRVGSPGIDDILSEAAPFSAVVKEFAGLRRRGYALLSLHPMDGREATEQKRARDVLAGIWGCGVEQVVIIDPNNDPGAQGIRRAWSGTESADCFRRANVGRAIFLGLLRDAAVLVGNSSAGIIEAASFGTPVVDVGPRQSGRERWAGVKSVTYKRADIRAAVGEVWNSGGPRRGGGKNPYRTDGRAGARIADILGRTVINDTLLKKLITY